MRKRRQAQNAPQSGASGIGTSGSRRPAQERRQPKPPTGKDPNPRSNLAPCPTQTVSNDYGSRPVPTQSSKRRRRRQHQAGARQARQSNAGESAVLVSKQQEPSPAAPDSQFHTETPQVEQAHDGQSEEKSQPSQAHADAEGSQGGQACTAAAADNGQVQLQQPCSQLEENSCTDQEPHAVEDQRSVKEQHTVQSSQAWGKDSLAGDSALLQPPSGQTEQDFPTGQQHLEQSKGWSAPHHGRGQPAQQWQQEQCHQGFAATGHFPIPTQACSWTGPYAKGELGPPHWQGEPSFTAGPSDGFWDGRCWSKACPDAYAADQSYGQWNDQAPSANIERGRYGGGDGTHPSLYAPYACDEWHGVDAAQAYRPGQGIRAHWPPGARGSYWGQGSHTSHSHKGPIYNTHFNDRHASPSPYGVYARQPPQPQAPACKRGSAAWHDAWQFWTRDAILIDGWDKLTWQQLGYSVDAATGMPVPGPMELAWSSYWSPTDFRPAVNVPDYVANLAQRRYVDLYCEAPPPLHHHQRPIYEPLYKIYVPAWADPSGHGRWLY